MQNNSSVERTQTPQCRLQGIEPRVRAARTTLGLEFEMEFRDLISPTAGTP